MARGAMPAEFGAMVVLRRGRYRRSRYSSNTPPSRSSCIQMESNPMQLQATFKARDRADFPRDHECKTGQRFQRTVGRRPRKERVAPEVDAIETLEEIAKLCRTRQPMPTELVLWL